MQGCGGVGARQLGVVALRHVSVLLASAPEAVVVQDAGLDRLGKDVAALGHLHRLLGVALAALLLVLALALPLFVLPLPLLALVLLAALGAPPARVRPLLRLRRVQDLAAAALLHIRQVRILARRRVAPLHEPGVHLVLDHLPDSLLLRGPQLPLQVQNRLVHLHLPLLLHLPPPLRHRLCLGLRVCRVRRPRRRQHTQQRKLLHPLPRAQAAGQEPARVRLDDAHRHQPALVGRHALLQQCLLDLRAAGKSGAAAAQVG